MRLGHLIETRNEVEAEQAADRPAAPDVRAEWERLIGDFEASIQASGLALRTVEQALDESRSEVGRHR